MQVIAALQPQGLAPLPEELRQQGLDAQLDACGRVRVRQTRPAGVVAESTARTARTAGFGASGMERVIEEGGGGVEETAGGGDGVAEMVAELRGMGLRAEVDPDTGLVDIAHPDAPPARFAYP